MAAEPIVLTTDLLRALVVCERRMWLDRYGDSGAAAPEPRAIYAVRAGALRRVEVTSWAEGVVVTQRLMAEAVDTIFDACLEATLALDLSDRRYSLRATADRLRRVRAEERDHYAPIAIRRQGQPDEADWLQLDVCVWLLETIRGVAPPAELWLGMTGNDQPRRRIAHDYDENRLLSALTRVAQRLDDPAAPPVALRDHCKECPWYAACQTVARQAGSLDLLYGVSHRTRHNMRQAGLATLADVAASSAEELQRVKGIGPATAPVLRANAQAWLEARPIRYHPFPTPADPAAAWMFDLETLEAHGQALPWSLGWCDTRGEAHNALVAPVAEPTPLTLLDGATVTLVPDYETAWTLFAQALSASTGIIYHWTDYDAAILRGTAPTAAREQLEPRMADLHRLFTRSVSLPLKSTSIKAVSVYLGYPWVGTNHWFEAFLDYRRWIETDDLAALTRACLYQRADVQSMAWVWRWLTGTTP